ncbi:MAG: LysE family translocator [Opitutales bacterium]|nr:LysE family translocator [Opitutales bacterium]
MNLTAALSLSLIMVTLAAIPSASVALVVVRSATGGVRSGLAVAAGIVVADLLFVALAITGMSVIAEALGSFFAVLRYAAGVYLIWLGVHLIRSRRTAPSIPGVALKHSTAGSFLAGFLLTLGDLKAILFYASLFPALLDLTKISLADGLLIVFVTAVTVGGTKAFYAVAARRLVHRFHTPERSALLRTSGGFLLAGTGTYLVLKT